MKEIPLHSSALSGFWYDLEGQKLWLRFRTGDLYVYQMVPAAVVEALLKARSHGDYFNSAIRGHFKSSRLS
jgi:hypothetical protein